MTTLPQLRFNEQPLYASSAPIGLLRSSTDALIGIDGGLSQHVYRADRQEKRNNTKMFKLNCLLPTIDPVRIQKNINQRFEAKSVFVPACLSARKAVP